VLLEQQVEAPRHRKQALEHRTALQVVGVAAPAVKDVVVCEATAAAAGAGMSAVKLMSHCTMPGLKHIGLKNA
jgi:hypothetical protein